MCLNIVPEEKNVNNAKLRSSVINKFYNDGCNEANSYIHRWTMSSKDAV